MNCGDCPYDDPVERYNRYKRLYTPDDPDWQPEYLWCDKVGGENIQEYILKVLNSIESTIINKAIELMQNDIEKARLESIDEAKAILEQTQI